MPRRAVVVGISASALLLVGCTAAVTPRPPTDGELIEFAMQQSDKRWQSFGLLADMPKPEVSQITFSTLDNWAPTITECLTVAGFETSTSGGGFSIVDDESEVEARVAMWTCMARYPLNPIETGYLSAEQALYMYDFYVNRLAPCLALMGYPSTPAPDREQYVGLLRSGAYWNPYVVDWNQVRQTDREKWKRIDARCGHLPDDPYWRYHPLSQFGEDRD
jgi:hypothetical protein